MKDKPNMWGIKVWTFSDSKTGYIYATIIYTGNANKETVKGLGDIVVCGLLKGFDILAYTRVHGQFLYQPKPPAFARTGHLCLWNYKEKQDGTAKRYDHRRQLQNDIRQVKLSGHIMLSYLFGGWTRGRFVYYQQFIT